MENYLLTVMNISAENLCYRIVKSETIEEATLEMKKWYCGIMKNHPFAILEDEKITKITNDMNIVRFVKTNGYTLNERFLSNIEEWERRLQEIFENELLIITHFYYGDELDMVDVVLKDGNYMRYNITEKSVGCSGHTCTKQQYQKFVLLQTKQ